MKTISIIRNLFLSISVLFTAFSINAAEVGAGDPTQSLQAQKAARKKAAQKKKDKRKKENRKLKGQGAEINKSILADKEAILESVKKNGSKQDVINAFFAFIALDEVDTLEQLKNIATERGFDLVNTPNQGKIMPLIYAVDMEKFESAKWLLRNNANLDVTDNKGNTAETLAKRNLSIALAEGEDQDVQINEEIIQEIELARLRKEAGSDIKKAVRTETDVKSASKLKASESHFDLPSAAVWHGAGEAQVALSEKEKALLKGLGVQSIDELAQKPGNLAESVRYNLIRFVHQSINAGADIEDRDTYGYTPLMVAAKLGNAEATQLLLQVGARIDTTYKPFKLKKDASLSLKIEIKKDAGKTAFEMAKEGKPEYIHQGVYIGHHPQVMHFINEKIKQEKVAKAEEEKKKIAQKQADEKARIEKQKEDEKERQRVNAERHIQKEAKRKAREEAQKAEQERIAREKEAAAALQKQKEDEKEKQRQERERQEEQERQQIRVRLEQERKDREAREKEAQRLKDEQIRQEKEEKERREREVAEQARLKRVYGQAAGDAAREAREKERLKAQHLQGLRQDVAEINTIYTEVAERGQKLIALQHQQELAHAEQQKKAREREIERKKKAERDAEWAQLQMEAERDEEDDHIATELFGVLEGERLKEYQEQDRKRAEEKARQEKIRLEKERKEREAKKAMDQQIKEELLRLRAQRETQRSQREADVTRAYEEQLKRAKELLLNGAITGDLVRVKLALEMNKHCVNAIDNGGNTPLMLAVSFGHKQVINFLLDIGIKVDGRKNNQGRSTFDLVCLYNQKFDYADLLKREPFIQELQARKQREEAEKQETERIRIEQEDRQKKEAEARLKAKFDTNGHLMLEKCENLQDAIESAITFTQNGKGIKYDESARNDIAQQVKKAWIFEAINRGSIDELRVSIAAGADLNSWNEDYDGDTPLILAINKGLTNLVDVLLSAGANARAGNRVGGTPFQAAARHARTTRSMDLL
ncbi:MAG TPA: ankyrin repeat domain-containing protein, partial [Candidatus Babeliales bacterium]|nr:ankyrin repeat domain-containing protein [Candidatus Babeliales bacterium]